MYCQLSFSAPCALPRACHHVNPFRACGAASRFGAIQERRDGAGRPRRFPAPWRVIEHSESFVVEDANGRPLAYVYFEDEPVRHGLMNRLTSNEARRVVSNIAKLPDLLKKS